MPRFLAFILAAAFLPVLARADERPYAFTYEPVVSAQGELEVELYETQAEPRLHAAADRSWEHQLEVGYGVTDRLSVSGYGVFRTTDLKAFELSAVRLEGRYKLLSASSAPVDLVLYLEGEKEVVDDKPWGLEEKVILGRRYARVSWAANLMAEQEWPTGGGLETKLGWNLGMAYQVNDRLKVGAETFGERVHGVDGTVEVSTYAGPSAVLTLPSGPFNSAWLIVGAAFGLRQADDLVHPRVVLGADF
jgi:hypothetical protein